MLSDNMLKTVKLKVEDKSQLETFNATYKQQNTRSEDFQKGHCTVNI